MGKRIMLLKQEAIGILFAPRGKNEALIVRIAGPDIPDNAKMTGFSYMPEKAAVGLVLESPDWSDLVVAGSRESAINGIPLLNNVAKNFKLVRLPLPATIYPPCAIDGYDVNPFVYDSSVVCSECNQPFTNEAWGQAFIHCYQNERIIMHRQCYEIAQARANEEQAAINAAAPVAVGG